MTASPNAEDGLGTGPKSHQKLRKIKRAPGPVVPRQCLSCADRCGCTREMSHNPPRFLDCWRAPKEKTT
jgi:hypothetical protein